MSLIRSVPFVCVAAGLLAQTPPPKPVQPPKPTVTLSAENPGAPPAPEVPPDRVVITMGDVKITAAQFDQIVNTLNEQVRAQARGPRRKDFADNIVSIMVLAEEGKREKLDQGPAYQTQSMFVSASVLAGMAYQELSKNIKVDDATARQYFEQHKAELEQVRARHILIRMQGSPLPLQPGHKDLTDAEALAKAQELRQKLVGGADFAEVAKAESDDTGSAANGGDLGFFGHGKMVPPFEQAAFALKIGELSEPVKSSFGYHVIRVDAVKGLDDVRPDIERRVRAQEGQKAVQDLVKKANAQFDPEYFGAAAK